MVTELDYLKWVTNTLDKFGKLLNVPLDPIPVDDDWPVVTITTESGMKLTGKLKETRQPKRYLIKPGTTLEWIGGLGAPLGKAHTNWGLPGVIGDTYFPDHWAQMYAESGVVIALPKAQGVNDPTLLQEAVLVEAHNLDLMEIPLRSWPKTIKGATEADVNTFLKETPFWMDLVEGWQGRYAHPKLNMPSAGEPGYGGALTDITSFGALLLCSDLPDPLKLKVQDRFLYLYNYLKNSDINFPADGGHGNGRLIISLIGQFIYQFPDNPTATKQYSELIQVYRKVDGTIDWRHNPTAPVGNGEEYRICCTANRWAGAAIAASLIFPTGLTQPTQDWITYTKGYLTQHFNDSGLDAWHFCNYGRTAELLKANRIAIGI